MITKKLAAAAVVLAALASPAAAQHYQQWGNISPWGLEVVDPYGNLHYVNPYAYDSQVNPYGDIRSSYSAPLAPSLGWSQLTPTPSPYSSWSPTPSTNPYAGATDSHEKFLEMIWE